MDENSSKEFSWIITGILQRMVLTPQADEKGTVISISPRKKIKIIKGNNDIIFIYL